MAINFNSYQQKARETAIYMDKVMEHYPDMPVGVQRMVAMSYTSLGLGESGEIQGKVKKLIRDKGTGAFNEADQNAIKKELGDLLYYIAAMADVFNLSLEEIAQANIDKLADRKERGVLTGSGDNR